MDFPALSDRWDRRSGFSLMELLVVVAIVGLAWFALLPNLDIAGRSRSEEAATFADFLAQVRAKAMNTHSLEKVQVVVGRTDLAWGEETLTLPSPVQSCLVNGVFPPGLEFGFAVYPTGAMDSLELALHSGETIMTTALGAVTVEEQ